MNNAPNKYAEAAGMLRIALRRMATAFPFHAALLSEGQFEASAKVSTMGVTIRHGQLTFLYAPEFVVTCSFEQLAGLLHHEINHVLFDHMFMDRAQYPDARARTIVQEVTVNEWVREPLPGRPITLAEYPQLPPGEDTATRYFRLVHKDGKGEEKAPKSVPAVPKKGRFSTKSSPDGTKKLGPVRTLDDHSVWKEAQNSRVLNRMAVSAAVGSAPS